MNNIVYMSPFKDHFQNYLDLKRALGYKFDEEAAHLKRFDIFILEKYQEATDLTKEIVLDWCSRKTCEAQANQRARASIIRQFGKYLDSIDVKTYILPNGYYPWESQYIPYIYTIDELTKFFAETDKFRYTCRHPPYAHLIMPLIFRMIYMCGLRASEATRLKVGDVDLEAGILSIFYSKKGNSRLVVMSDSLTERCRSFSKNVHLLSRAEDYYFPTHDGNPMTTMILYHNFRNFLWKAGISHGGRGRGPRIHDFRHTYAVHCLKKWAEQEKNLSAYIPILKTYMGHHSFNETAYYLRMTADVFPHVTLKLETHYLDIIPQLEGGTNHETY